MATNRLIRPLVVLLAVWGGTVLAGPFASAGEYNEVLSIGDVAPAWSELPGVDGRKHSLKDLADKQVVVVVFTCNSCPVATDYEDRLIELAKQTQGNGTVAFVAINVNRVKEDSPQNMKARAESKGFPFLYLFDETQKIAKGFGANFTPEFFVLNKERKVVYMGSLDDHSDPKLAKQPYLATAIQAALAGQPSKPAETLAIGCRIRYVRERK
jgi:peroxiredoxin